MLRLANSFIRCTLVDLPLQFIGLCAWFGFCWTSVLLWPNTSQATTIKSEVDTTTLHCRVVYQPNQTLWVREVKLLSHRFRSEWRLQSVHIDGVPVYTFTRDGAKIWTALDNERIHLHLATHLWSSDFRGLAQGEGLCKVVF